MTVEPDESLAHLIPQSIAFAPHNDDETLFAAFTLQRHRPRVVVVLRSYVQLSRYGIPFEEREAETAAALYELGCPYEQWAYRDDDPDWAEIGDRIRRLANTYDRCFAPAVEEDGHEHHSMVGRLAVAAFGQERVTRYLTYRRGHGKSRSSCEVVPAHPDYLAGKLRALSCYRSQMLPETGCASWFAGDLREYVEC